MPALVAGIHVFLTGPPEQSRGWPKGVDRDDPAYAALAPQLVADARKLYPTAALSQRGEDSYMRRSRSRSTLKDAIDQCSQEVYELCDSIRGAFEGTPDVLKDSTGKPRELAANRLEIASDFLEPPPKSLEEVEVSWREKRAGINGKLFRPARRDNVVNCLEACVRRLSTPPQDETTLRLKERWELAIKILESIYFPSMFARRAA